MPVINAATSSANSLPASSSVTAGSSMSSPAGSKSLPSSGKESPPPEYHVLFVGTHHKQPLVGAIVSNSSTDIIHLWVQFEKLLCISEKYERHIQYHDTCYLNFNYPGQGPVVIELNDPGIEHTGAREMAIRKADAVILHYAMYSAHSFHQLTAIAEDFKQRKNGSYVS